MEKGEDFKHDKNGSVRWTRGWGTILRCSYRKSAQGKGEMGGRGGRWASLKVILNLFLRSVRMQRGGGWLRKDGEGPRERSDLNQRGRKKGKRKGSGLG